jgi:hypothetical protein
VRGEVRLNLNDDGRNTGYVFDTSSKQTDAEGDPSLNPIDDCTIPPKVFNSIS